MMRVLFVFFLAFHSVCQATDFLVVGGHAMREGESFSVLDGFTNSRLIDWDGTPDAAESAGVSFELEIRQIESVRQYVSESGVSANGSGSYGLFRGDAAYSEAKSLRTCKNKLIYQLQVLIRFSPMAFGDNPELSPRGQAFLDENGLDGFIAAVGPHLVTHQVRGAMCNVYLIVETSSAESRTAVQKRLSVGWATANAKVNLASEIRSVDRNASYRTIMKSQGDHGFIQPLSKVIRADIGDIKAIKSAIAESIGALDAQQCPIVACKTTPIWKIPEILSLPNAKRLVNHRIRIEEATEKRLVALDESSTIAAADERYLDAILDTITDVELVPNGRKTLESERNRVRDEVKRLHAEAMRIQDATTSNDVQNIDVSYRRPVIAGHLKSLVEFIGWETKAWHDITNVTGPEQINTHADFCPRLRLIRPELIRSLHFKCRLIGAPESWHPRLKEQADHTAFVFREKNLDKIAEQMSTDGYFHSRWTFRNIRAWGRHPDQISAKVAGNLRSVRSYEKKLRWSLVVTDVQGHQHVIPLGSVSNTVLRHANDSNEDFPVDAPTERIRLDTNRLLGVAIMED